MKRWGYLLAVPLAFIQIPGPVAWAQTSPAPLPAALAPSAAPAAGSSAAQNAPAAPAYSQAQLEQMLAPIALYPDDLLTQVLAASTYPLEIVMAERWLSQPGNAALKGDALTKALDVQDWDPSVKSLIPFPTVLSMMNQQLDWTQQLGNAFLAQQADVFAAVQTLRKRAQAAGKLQSNAQQVVSQQQVSGAAGTAPSQAIIIAPAQPDTVYVPVYNPTIVYGAWPYPAYPPVYYPPPAGYVAGTALLSGIAFGAGVAIAGGLWGWGSPNWGRGNITVNNTRYNNINVNHNNQFNNNTWQHNPQHRRGTPYPNNFTRQQYQPNHPNTSAQRDAFRGRATPVPNQPNQNRPNVNRPAQPPGNHARPGAQGGQQNFRPQNMQRPQQWGGAFGGIDHGATTRAQMNRGQASRSAATPNWGGRGGWDGGGRGGFGGGRRR